MITDPRISRIRINGSNQNFFLVFMKAQSSVKNSFMTSEVNMDV